MVLNRDIQIILETTELSIREAYASTTKRAKNEYLCVENQNNIKYSDTNRILYLKVGYTCPCYSLEFCNKKEYERLCL